MRKAFTIIELLMVIGVIAVLMTIVTTAAMNSIRSSRSQRTAAMKTALQTALATYQAADSQGKWPAPVQTVADGGVTRVLSQAEAQRAFRIVVQRSTGESGSTLPLIDPHGLFVAPSGAQDGVTVGRSYDDARRKGAHHQRTLPVAQMEFGYPGTKTGKFYHYNIIFHAESDSVTVSTCCEKCLTINGCRDGNCPYCHKKER